MVISKRFINTGIGQFGSIQYYTVGKTADYVLIAQGAKGSGGNRYDKAYKSFGGVPAVVSTKVNIKAGTALAIVVGQMGSCVNATSRDGTSGGGGGATMVFKQIPAITDTRYQISKAGIAYETLVVAAGGGGSEDASYLTRESYGKNADITNLASIYNYFLYSNLTFSSSNAQRISGGGISQFAVYDAIGGYFTRNNGKSIGGFGGGGSADDTFCSGGGWKATGSGSAYSWALTGGTIKLAQKPGHSWLLLMEDIEWEAPVWDRTSDDYLLDKEKGFLSATDLNRIEKNIAYLERRFVEEGYAPGTITNAKYPWNRTKYLKIADYRNIQQNIERLRAVFTKTLSLPTLVLKQPDVVYTYQELNYLEFCLYDLKDLFEKAIRSYKYCGNTYTTNL